MDPIPPPPLDAAAPPVPDAEYRIYERLYLYDKAPLEARVDHVEERSGVRRERVSLRAAYGTERLTLFLFLPTEFKPPYQAVAYFPGSWAIHARSSEAIWTGALDFIVKSGRAACFPIYQGTYERYTGLKDDDPDTSALYRDHMIMWAKDLGRAIDYLETRPDLDTQKLAYYGISWGAALGAVLPAVERRLKVAVLDAGGLFRKRALPEADQRTFAPRLKIPVLMVNGRYDYAFPVASSQSPLFRLLGAPAREKAHVVLESGHWELTNQRIQVILDWLDRHLGPVER